MILNPWILTMLTGHAALFFVFSLATINAWWIFSGWDFTSSSEKQYGLEKRTYLVSSVMNLTLIIQMLMLFLLVMAADELAKILPGAMCATGSLSSNKYGFPLLMIKIGSFFIYFVWWVLNYLDNQLEDYPLVRKKYLALVCIFPVMISETILLLLFAVNLNPTVIASCCGSIYNESSAGLGGTMAGSSPLMTLTLFFGVVSIVLIWHMIENIRGYRPTKKKGGLEALLWVFLFVTALLTVISFISTYIYEMLSHKCPFCLLKAEYNYIGVPLYFFLFLATATGLTKGVLQWMGAEGPLGDKTILLRRRLGQMSIFSLLVYIVVGYSPFIIYYIRTGRTI
ncbi:MAG: hypothetical protein HOC09_22250 [Deltaproteobacteria bacterium]|nr:hypothetical protein [Deltaproteobacteria bacterium]